MLEDLVRLKLDEIESTENLWIMQNEVALLREISPNRLISLRDDISWPAQSPDMNPCDFFFSQSRDYR